ncbi:hypothetical protein NKH72_22235 [Mesorhizobium sp. M0955]|uniref:hypothetical protein n=1 Tax=Mesorhizobium sp. M0955 TaxID=2957033 RepID=UPI003339B4AE
MSVHLGLKNGRMGLWTAPAGQDASSEGDVMTLNSDLDHLQIHASGTFSLNGAQESSHWRYQDQTINFPTLTYYPSVFLGASPSTDKGLVFPPIFSTDYGSSGWKTGDLIPYYVYMDKIVLRLQPSYFFSPSYRVSYFVFKNRFW